MNLWKEKFEKEKEKRIKCEKALHLLEQRFTTLNMSMGKEILKKPFGPKGSKNKSSAKTQSKKVKNTKKYQSRKSPPYSAAECCGMTFMGNDGTPYIAEKRGTSKSCRWYKLK